MTDASSTMLVLAEISLLAVATSRSRNPAPRAQVPLLAVLAGQHRHQDAVWSSALLADRVRHGQVLTTAAEWSTSTLIGSSMSGAMFAPAEIFSKAIETSVPGNEK